MREGYSSPKVLGLPWAVPASLLDEERFFPPLWEPPFSWLPACGLLKVGGGRPPAHTPAALWPLQQQ